MLYTLYPRRNNRTAYPNVDRDFPVFAKLTLLKSLLKDKKDTVYLKINKINDNDEFSSLYVLRLF